LTNPSFETGPGQKRNEERRSRMKHGAWKERFWLDTRSSIFGPPSSIFHPRSSADDPISPFLFGLIKLLIRLANHLIAGNPVFTIAGGDSHADGHVKGFVLVSKGMAFHQRPETFGEFPGAVRIRFRHDDGKFLAAIAGNQIAFPDSAFDAGSQLSEGHVAGQMAHLIVDRVEPIQV